MTKLLFAFCLAACIITAVVSDLKLRNLDGRPLLRESGIETLSFDNGNLRASSTIVDITAKLVINSIPEGNPGEILHASAPWNLSNKIVKGSKTAEERKTITSKFHCRAFLVGDKTNYTVILSYDLPVITYQQKVEALRLLSRYNLDSKRVIFTTTGILAPVTISPANFAGASFQAVSAAFDSLSEFSYTAINITDTLFHTHVTRIGINGTGSVDLPAVPGVAMPTEKVCDATNAVNRWFSFFTKDTSLLPNNSVLTSPAEPLRIHALVFRNAMDKIFSCIVYSNISPTILAGTSTISTDIAGNFAQQLEKRLECTVIYHTMPSANLSLFSESADIGTVRRIGGRMAQLISSEVRRSRFGSMGKSFAYNLPVNLPIRKEFTLPESAKVIGSMKYASQIKDIKSVDIDLSDKRMMFERALCFAKAANHSGFNSEKQELKALRLDTLMLLYLPCNLLSQTADSICRIMPQTVLLSTCLDGQQSAIFPELEMEKGGWHAATSIYDEGAYKGLVSSVNSIISSTFPRIFRKRIKEKL